MDAGVYARISKDTEGTELGVTRQIQDCHAEATRRGWSVLEDFVDNDVSATRSKARPSYERMMADVRAGRIKAIVVWDVDRLSRTPRELEDIIDLADKYGLALANVGGEIDLSTPQGRMMARIKGTVARHEVEQQSKRLKRKFREKAEKGEPHGYSPYGYSRVDGRDVADEEEAAIVRETARRVLAGESLRAVVGDLNSRGIHGPKAPKWNTTILRQILLRPSNAGLRQYQGHVIGQSTTEPILGEDVHHELVAMLTDPTRRSNQAGPGFKYLLSGVAICGRCGGSMRRQMGRTVGKLADGSTKRQPPSYACSACFRVRRQQQPVDDLVSELVVRRLSEPDAAILFSSADSATADNAQKQIDTIDAKLSLAADQFADDIITGTQLKRISIRLRQERTTAENTLNRHRPSTALASLRTGDIRATWDAMPVQSQREVVNALATITIHPSGSGKQFDPELISVKWKQT